MRYFLTRPPSRTTGPPRPAANEVRRPDLTTQRPDSARHPARGVRAELGPRRRTINRMTDSKPYREFVVDRLLPSEVQWALHHDAVHGIAYAFENPIAVTDASDDPDDARQTYLIRADPEDVANAIVEINEWIIDQPR